MASLVWAARTKVRQILASADDRRHAAVGPMHLWRMKREFQIAFLAGQGLCPEHHLLDIGCGTLRGGVPIIRRLSPGHYLGIEVRAEVLEEGRRELAREGLTNREPILLHAPALAGIDLGRRFDFV
jgi:precorrin-6B methylase 2